MNSKTNQPMSDQLRHKRNALMISLITGIFFTLVSAIVGPIAYAQDGLAGLFGIVVTIMIALSGFICALLVSRNRVSLGVAILIITTLMVSFTLPFVAEGQGLALGVMLLILISGISSATLPSLWIRRAIIAGFIVAVLITLADLYLPDYGLPTNPIYTNTIAAITTLIYAFFSLRRFNTYPLRTKIIIAFTLTTIVPLFALIYYNNRSSTQALQEQGVKQLAAITNIAADTIDGFIKNQLDSVYSDAKQLTLVDYLETPLDSRKGSQEEKNAEQTLLALTSKNPVFIKSVALLSTDGKNVLDTYHGANQYEGNFTYFLRPISSGLPYASNIIFRDNKPNIYFSAPIRSHQGEIIGVLRVEYHGKIIQSLIRALDPGYKDTIISIVDLKSYMRVGYTGNRNNLFKSYKNFTDWELLAFQSDGRLPTLPKEEALSDTDDALVNGIDNLQLNSTFYSYSQPLGSDAINTGVFLKSQPWIALIQQSTETYLTPVKVQNKTNTVLALLLLGFSVMVGFVASQILTSPLVRLTKVAEKITSGDLSAQAEIQTDDEIGALASTFNRMTHQLNQTLVGLEQRVAERTTDLELSRQQSVKRANELQAIGEISKIITSEQKLELLLPLITRLVSERFGYYHTGVFLIDNVKQYAVLQAANSSGGQNMLKRGHKLEIGGNSIVGNVTKYGVARISLDVGMDAVYFNNPDLPSTRSEMTLPLKIRDRIVGALDVQSEKPGAFTENDASTLSILADQVAISIENARLFAQTERALNEAQTLYSQNLREGWKTFSREKEFVGYRQSPVGGKKLTKVYETDEIRQAVNRGEVLLFHADGVTEEATIVVPIKLRGQVIGSINVKAPAKNRQWSSDEVNLAETISERLSIALENARLIQESQRQVIKEQQISEVTGKIGASINLKNVLQTAVEELGRAMPGSEVMIQLKGDDK